MRFTTWRRRRCHDRTDTLDLPNYHPVIGGLVYGALYRIGFAFGGAAGGVFFLWKGSVKMLTKAPPKAYNSSVSQSVRREYIDGLKGIAILAITLTHTVGKSLPGIWSKIGLNGRSGVQLFFVISAYLSFLSLKRYCPDGFVTVSRWRGWIIKRMIRLIPLYYLAILICLVTKTWSTYWLGAEQHVTLKNIWFHLLFLHGLIPHYTDSILAVEWYLGALVLYYIVTPIIYRYVNSLPKAILFFVVVTVGTKVLNGILQPFFSRGYDEYIYESYYEYFSPIVQFPAYVIGIVVFFLTESINGTEIRGAKMLSYTMLFAAAYLLYGQLQEINRIIDLTPYTLFGVWYSLVIISQELHRSRIIDNPVFKFIGRYSYGIYLFQFIWINLFRRYVSLEAEMPLLLKYIINIMMLLVISYLCTTYFEKPITKLLLGSKNDEKHGESPKG